MDIIYSIINDRKKLIKLSNECNKFSILFNDKKES